MSGAYRVGTTAIRALQKLAFTDEEQSWRHRIVPDAQSSTAKTTTCKHHHTTRSFREVINSRSIFSKIKKGELRQGVTVQFKEHTTWKVRLDILMLPPHADR